MERLKWIRVASIIPYQPTGSVNYYVDSNLVGSAPLTSVSSFPNGGDQIYVAALSVKQPDGGNAHRDLNYPGDANFAGRAIRRRFLSAGRAINPTLSWATPAAITYGTALSGTQLNAAGNIPGKYVYTPAAGTVLSAGSHTLSVTFTPSDYTDFGPLTTTVSQVVNQVDDVDQRDQCEPVQRGLRTGRAGNDHGSVVVDGERSSANGQ